MAELLTLARPYAKAAFGYASEQGMADNWSTVLQLLSAMVQDEALHSSDGAGEEDLLIKSLIIHW